MVFENEHVCPTECRARVGVIHTKDSVIYLKMYAIRQCSRFIVTPVEQKVRIVSHFFISPIACLSPIPAPIAKASIDTNVIYRS